MLHFFKKYTKKLINKWTIAISICLVSILSLFAMTKTYAYHLNEDNNIVSENLIVLNDVAETTTNGVTYKVENGVLTLNGSASLNVYIDLGSIPFVPSTFCFFNDNTSNGVVYSIFSSNSQTWENYLSCSTTNANYSLSNTNYSNHRVVIFNGTTLNNFVIKPMLVKGTTAPTEWEQGGTWFNQNEYNTLQQQYNELQTTYENYQNTHSYSNGEYNQVVSLNNLLLQQIQSLELQYNTYVATHSYTNEQYNALNNQYQTLQNQYQSLQQQYNDLQDRFNEVIGESSSAMYFALNGATANLYTDVSGVKTLLASDTISINENYMNFDNSCIPNINTYLNGYDSEDTTTYPNPYCYIEIDLNMSVNSVLLFTFDNTILDVDITLSSTISNVTNIYKRNSSLNAYQLVVNKDRLSFNKISYDGIYMPDYISIDFSLDIDGYSYSIGYNKGVESQQSRINSLNSSVSSMQSSINTLRASNQQLQEQVNNTFGWKNLFFAMADTPFKTVSNVLGFELFGLNLFTTFIGMITVFAIIWLLKKFI